MSSKGFAGVSSPLVSFGKTEDSFNAGVTKLWPASQIRTACLFV